MKPLCIVEVRSITGEGGLSRNESYTVTTSTDKAWQVYERQRAGIKLGGSPLMFVTHPQVVDEETLSFDLELIQGKTKRGRYFEIVIPRIEDEEDSHHYFLHMWERRPRLYAAIVRAEEERRAQAWEDYGERVRGC